MSVDSMEHPMEETGTRLFRMDIIGEDLPGRKNNTKKTPKRKKHEGWKFGVVVGKLLSPLGSAFSPL